MTQSHETISVTHYTSRGQGQTQTLDIIDIIAEALVSVHVNGAEMVTIACTPIQQKELAVGFLLNEGLIEVGDLRAVHVCPSGLCIDVWLRRTIQPPARRILTSGCGGGVTFDDLNRAMQPLNSSVSAPVEQLPVYMKMLQGQAHLYRLAHGVHASGLFKDGQLISVTEDVGRHNTLDKIRGDCALRGIETQDGVLVTSGRVSSEMLNKAVRMGCPIVVSRTSATSLSVQLARAWNITLVGYVRGNQLTVYTGVERLVTSNG